MKKIEKMKDSNWIDMFNKINELVDAWNNHELAHEAVNSSKQTPKECKPTLPDAFNALAIKPTLAEMLFKAFQNHPVEGWEKIGADEAKKAMEELVANFYLDSAMGVDTRDELIERIRSL